MTPIEDRVHDELGRLVERYVPSPWLHERIVVGTRRRARHRQWAALLAIALVVLAAALGLAHLGIALMIEIAWFPTTTARYR